MKSHKKILFVCMGNICRSPSAEGIFRQLALKHPELQSLEIDSCGTIGFHEGEPADPRSISAAEKRGYDLTNIRSRKIVHHDLDYYDYILAMDNENISNLSQLTKQYIKNSKQNELVTNKICLFLNYSSLATKYVPDPYYGGANGFNDVIDLIEDASRGLISHLINNLSK